MAATWTTAQIAPLVANAGLQQTINVSSPSTLSLGVPSSPNTNGPGWATNNNTPTGNSGTLPPSFGFYLFMAAVGYFAFVKLR